MRKHIVTLIIVSCCITIYAENKAIDPLSLDDFAYKMTITAEPNHTFYSVLLPTAVYQGVTRNDLGDIRVFDAQGANVPYVIRYLHGVMPLSQPEHQWLTLTGKSGHQPNTYFFDTEGYMPIDMARIAFSGINTIMQVRLSSRHTPEQQWQYRRDGLVYHLKEQGRQRISPDFKINATTDQYWRLEVEDGQNSPHSPPTLSLGWLPQELIFVAQGEPPYTLAYGRNSVELTHVEINPMLEKFQKHNAQLDIAAATLGKQEKLSGDPALVTPINWLKWMLWAVVILGTLLLLWIVIRLFKLNQYQKNTYTPRNSNSEQHKL